MDGVILLAHIIAILANEIVAPTILMLYLGNTMMTDELTLNEEWRNLFVGKSNWTLLTAVNLMLFSLLQNPCATTIFTIFKETKRLKWTLLATFMPLAIALGVMFAVTQIVRFFSG